MRWYGKTVAFLTGKILEKNDHHTTVVGRWGFGNYTKLEATLEDACWNICGKDDFQVHSTKKMCSYGFEIYLFFCSYTTFHVLAIHILLTVSSFIENFS